MKSKDITLEKYLYLKGYTTYRTSQVKLKAQKGVAQFARDMFKLIEETDIVGFQNIAKEYQELLNNKYGK